MSRERALVTGASSGIGAAFAERLAGDGWNLVLVARREERLRELAARLGDGNGIDVEVLRADLTDPDELRSVEERLAAEPAIDMLVNNAGIMSYGRFRKMDLGREEELVRLNVLALVRLTHAALPGMTARGRGTLLNVSSRAAFRPEVDNATYAASKAFVNSFTRALAEDLAGTGVRVQALCPGNTRSEILERAGLDAATIASVPASEPEEVVDVSLRALEHGTLIVVPGERRLDRWMRRIVPRRVAGKLAGIFERWAR
ncbi:MAG: SDR family oxidoreductase [Planctomycetota bacterium]|nr:SDR family oxidoreductase [Planctomycetota bacterium]